MRSHCSGKTKCGAEVSQARVPLSTEGRHMRPCACSLPGNPRQQGRRKSRRVSQKCPQAQKTKLFPVTEKNAQGQLAVDLRWLRSLSHTPFHRHTKRQKTKFSKQDNVCVELSSSFARSPLGSRQLITCRLSNDGSLHSVMSMTKFELLSRQTHISSIQRSVWT